MKKKIIFLVVLCIIAALMILDYYNINLNIIEILHNENYEDNNEYIKPLENETNNNEDNFSEIVVEPEPALEKKNNSCFWW